MLIPYNKLKPIYHKFPFLSRIHSNAPKCRAHEDSAAAAVCAAVIGPFLFRGGQRAAPRNERAGQWRPLSPCSAAAARLPAPEPERCRDGGADGHAVDLRIQKLIFPKYYANYLPVLMQLVYK